MRKPKPGGATSAQIKDDIDSGRTGDKVRAFDPAAAPLGTDEEAAGTPTPPQAWQAMRPEEPAQDRERKAASLWWWVAAGVGAACAAIALVLASSGAT